MHEATKAGSSELYKLPHGSSKQFRSLQQLGNTPCVKIREVCAHNDFEPLPKGGEDYLPYAEKLKFFFFKALTKDINNQLLHVGWHYTPASFCQVKHRQTFKPPEGQNTWLLLLTSFKTTQGISGHPSASISFVKCFSAHQNTDRTLICQEATYLLFFQQQKVFVD